MQERNFHHMEAGECSEKKHISIPDLNPSIVIVTRPSLRLMVWCDEHSAYESVTDWEGDALTTLAGCRMVRRDPVPMAFWHFRDAFSNPDMLEKPLPQDKDDIFEYLCEAFGCEPTARMEALFDENPLFLATASLLQALGVRNEELQARFSALQTFFGMSPAETLEKFGIRPFSPTGEGIPVSKLFTDRETACAFLQSGDGSYSEWRAMLLYCRWRLFHQGEEVFAEHMYNMNAHWEPRFMDAAVAFYNCWRDMPDTMRSDLLREGLTENMQNRMIALAKEKANGRPEFSYGPTEKAYECRIGDYTFRLVDNRAKIHSLLRETGSFDWGNQLGARDNGILRVAMFREKEPVAVIILDGQAKLLFDVNCSSDGTKLKSANTRIAFLRWMKWTGLYKKYEPFHEADYAYLREDVHAEPLSAEQGKGGASS